jgi:GNAT superfamily N-acetyltransferase
MATLLNPSWLEAGAYTAFLNRVFPGQWDLQAYDWYIGRPFHGRRGDLLVQAEGSTVRAGMGLVPREILVNDGPPIPVGIVSAAATLPEERGRGQYAQLLEAALERGRERGYAALLGFVTADNASGRGLLRIGAQPIPSFYVFSSARSRPRSGWRARTDTRAAPETPAAEIIELCRRAPAHTQLPHAHFHYADRGDWEQQFLLRPHPVHAVRLRHDCLGLLEKVHGTDRLQCLACPGARATASLASLAAASGASGRRFFMYTLDPCEAAAARRLGLKVREGFLMLLPTDRTGKRSPARAGTCIRASDSSAARGRSQRAPPDAPNRLM